MNLSSRYLLQNGLRISLASAAFALVCAGMLYAQGESLPAGSQPTPAPEAASAAKTDLAAKPPVEHPAEIAASPSPAKTPAAAKPAPSSPKGDDSAKPYVIGPLDILSVKVWNQPQISGMVDVNPDGMISLPLIGEVKADGLTQKQLEALLTTRLGDVLTAPEVNVSVVKINSKHFYVYGGCMKCGPSRWSRKSPSRTR